MSKPRNYSNRFRLYYLLTLVALCCYDSYISVYLEQYLHMSGFQIGCFISVSMVAGLVIMPLYGAIGDKTGKYRQILMLCTAGTILFSFLLSMQTGFALLIVMGIGFELNRCSILAMADTQTICYCTNSGSPYGSIRCFGSIGWIVGSALCAFLVRKFGLNHVFFRFFMAAMACSLINILFLPRQTIKSAPDSEQPENKEAKSGDIASLLKNGRFLFIILFALMTGGLAEVVTAYASLHMVSTLGAAEYLVSIYSIIGAGPEILFLLLLNKFLLPHLGFRRLFLCSAAAMSIRMLLFAVVPNVPLFFAASCLTFLTTACTTGLNVQYIRQVVPERSIGSAASIYNAVFMGGRALFSLIFGGVYEASGSRTVFWLCFAFAAVAFLMALFVRKIDIVSGGKEHTA
ncbi:MAG: MFS transporter [Lachnospiraceae bacterium]|nr:MFS transporter [Lachnospiraceae bacterium]